MACDLVVATESAWFSLPEVRNGFLASGGGAIRAAQWLPRAIAMEILLLGERFSARRAHEWGLVNRVVPDGRSLSTALDLAYRIATSAPLAVQATKRLVAGIVDSTAVTEAEAWAATTGKTPSSARPRTRRKARGPLSRNVRPSGSGDSDRGAPAGRILHVANATNDPPVVDYWPLSRAICRSNNLFAPNLAKRPICELGYTCVLGDRHDDPEPCPACTQFSTRSAGSAEA